MVFELE